MYHYFHLFPNDSSTKLVIIAQMCEILARKSNFRDLVIVSINSAPRRSEADGWGRQGSEGHGIDERTRARTRSGDQDE